MTNGLRVAVASVVVTIVAVASAGPATADNSNNNSNTNDVTNIGGSSSDMGATSDENKNWPPTASDWPPQGVLDAGDNGSRGKDNSASNPIVMPLGQTAPAASETPSTTETTKPIVPVGTP